MLKRWAKVLLLCTVQSTFNNWKKVVHACVGWCVRAYMLCVRAPVRGVSENVHVLQSQGSFNRK